MELAVYVAWALLLIAALACLANERSKRIAAEAFPAAERVLLERLLAQTHGNEPIRRDENDPLRRRYVFCGRWPEQGHSPTCVWQAAAAHFVEYAAEVEA